MKKQLFSVILTHYNQNDYIYEALNSILCQDYPNIQLIISDDCSKKFDENKIKNYVISRCKHMDLSFVVNKKNIGTVKTMNKCLKKINGNYIYIIAADDKLNNDHVFSDFVDFFNKNENAKLVTSYTNLYDNKFELINRKFPLEEENANFNMSAEEQNRLLLHGPFFAPGATAYRRELFIDLNYFDEKYILIEDWSFFLRATRLNNKVYFLPIISLDHRGGGVSESPRINKSLHKKVIKDTINIYNNEVFSQINTLSKHEINKIVARYKIFFIYNFRVNIKLIFNYYYKVLTKRKLFITRFDQNKIKIFSLISSSVLLYFLLDDIDNVYYLAIIPPLLYFLFYIFIRISWKIVKKVLLLN